MAEDSLSVVAYGPAGSGKTTLGLTGPSPTIMFDVETASRFIPRSRRVYWNPSKGEALPDISNVQDAVVVVRVKKWDDVEAAMRVIRGHNHPFRTLMFDSISEVIDKAKKEISDGQFKIQEWGELGRVMGDLLRELRDITADPDSPIEMCYMITMDRVTPGDPDKGIPAQHNPLLEGSAKNIVSYLYDLVAFVEFEDQPSDPNNAFSPKVTVQTFYTGKSRPGVTAKSRVPGLPETINALTLKGLLRGVFGAEPEPEPANAPDPAPAAEPAAEKKTPAKKSAPSGVPSLPED